MIEPAPGWGSYKLGDVVENVNEYYDRSTPGPERYVAGDHIDEGSLSVQRWGLTSDDVFPPTFNRRFQAGDVLFHSRNLRKLVQPAFDGVTGEKLFVLRVYRRDLLLPSLLPFLLQSSSFDEYVNRMWAGSTNKFLNKTPLMQYELALPGLDEQRRILHALTSVESVLTTALSVSISAKRLLRSSMNSVVRLPSTPRTGVDIVSGDRELRSLEDLVSPGRTISYGILKPGDSDPTGVPMLRVMDFDDLGRRTETQVARVARSVAETSSSTYLRPGDVLVSVMATIGRCFLVGEEMDGWNVNRALAVLPFENSVGEYVEACLQSGYFQELLQLARIGSAQDRINLEFLKRVEIPLPNEDGQRRVIHLRRSLGQAIARTEGRVRSTQELKTSLLRRAWGA